MQTFTVFAGSSGFAPQSHNEAAKALGHACADKDITLCFGGMNAGLMYLVAEAARRNKGRVIGVIPSRLRDSERVHKELSELITVETLWERKREMYFRADAVIALPGGFGTFDEVAEILYWGVLGFHAKPMLLLNIDGYWDELLEYLRNHVSQGEGELGHVTDFLLEAASVEEGFKKIQNWQAPDYAKSKDEKTEELPHFEDAFSAEHMDSIIISKATVLGCYQIGTALALRQLGKHSLPIGLLNENGNFDLLLDWVEHASKARYITAKCSDLFATAPTTAELAEKLSALVGHEIDLHEDKWGDKPEF
jgi:uncharacterized protein (TIGR00730 family)